MATSEFSSRQTIQSKRARFAENCFWLWCAYPLLWLSQLYALGIYAWLRLGHWPSYNNSSPESMDVVANLQKAGVVFGILLLCIWPFAFSYWTIALVRICLFRFRWHGWGLLLAVVGGALAYWQVQGDPTGLWNWFWD